MARLEKSRENNKIVLQDDRSFCEHLFSIIFQLIYMKNLLKFAILLEILFF